MYSVEYNKKLTNPDQAVELVESGNTMVHGVANCEPPALLEAVARRVRGGKLSDLKVYSLHPIQHAANTVLTPDLNDRIASYSWFLTASDRELVKAGIDFFIPNELHHVPRLCREFMNIDVTMTTVSPMDKAGFFSFGVANLHIPIAARHCKRLIVEVNPNMPRVFGDSFVHISEIDAIVVNEVELPEILSAPLEPESEIIGRRIAEMIPDGATIQIGVGGIPDAVTKYLENHKDLGIHTEILTPGMIDLVKKGVINGKRKSIHPRKHIFTGVIGHKESYEFVNDNPSMESYPVCYTNDPRVIAQNENMISVNSTIEVDLTGQCNSEFLAGMEFSGTGGQLDFVRGAFESKGGKSFIAFYSTAKKGEISRIVPQFEPGAVVTTPRMDVHYLATEYGIVNLMGKSTHDRALDLISIAHPKFRDDLLNEAKKLRII
ncbi:MAG: acetyl-CoA hydrolase/transferase family protein [Deltaproteobacteria bacterium]|nr:MAG: acetyl-CoA hydrolase/transferase family protein [Deltaproteobacteria bacterium]